MIDTDVSRAWLEFVLKCSCWTCIWISFVNCVGRKLWCFVGIVPTTEYPGAWNTQVGCSVWECDETTAAGNGTSLSSSSYIVKIVFWFGYILYVLLQQVIDMNYACLGMKYDTSVDVKKQQLIVNMESCIAFQWIINTNNNIRQQTVFKKVRG